LGRPFFVWTIRLFGTFLSCLNVLLLGIDLIKGKGDKMIESNDKSKANELQVEKPFLHENEGLISDEEIRIAIKKTHSGIKGDLDDNEEENTEQKGFDRSSR